LSATGAAPTTATLSISSSATSGAATPAAVTLNAAADQAYTVTWSFAGSPTLTGVTSGQSVIAIGQTTHPAVTAAWAAAGGPHAVDFTISPSLTRAGRPMSVTVSAPVSAGTWQTLTVASHSRKVLTVTPNGTTTVSLTPALTVEAQSPVTVSSIPGKAFGVVTPGERGRAYYAGGLHSNYQGNEIDRLTLPFSGTEIVTTLSHQPNIPPYGPFSGYQAGNGGYIYRAYDTGLGDNTLWQPHPGHQWTKQGWNPYWGFFSNTAHALQASYPNGAYTLTGGLLTSSAAQITDTFGDQEETAGLVAFDWTTNKYKTHVTSVGLPYPFDQLGMSGATDWNNWTQEQLFFNVRSARLNIARWNPISGLTYLANMVASPDTSSGVIGGSDGQQGNGLLIRVLEQRKYLIKREQGPSTAGAFHGALFLYSQDFGSGDARFVALTPPAGAFSDVTSGGEDNLTFTVDKNSRRVFWLVFPGVTIPCRLYVSTFDDLMSWTQITFTPNIVIPDTPFAYTWLAANRQPMIFQDGYIFLVDGGVGPNPDPGYINGTLHMRRIKVDSGEDLPAMSFTRYDYRKQTGINTLPNFGFTFSSDPGVLQLWGVKHANWAYNPVDSKHYLCAGDLGSSTTGSLATLTFSGDDDDDFLFVETLDEETLPPSGTVRPSSPDDGYWFRVPADSAWVEARGKFVWQRGGDGEPMFYNAYLRAVYGASTSNGTIAQVEAALADGWDLASKYYLFDQATTTFTPLGVSYSYDTSTAEAPPSAAGTRFIVSNTNGWTQDNGSTFYPDAWTASSAASRNGALDSTTGKTWRFYSTGSPSLASFDWVNKVVKFHTLARWLSPETGRNYYTSGAAPTTAGDVIADGTKEAFGFFDTGSSRYITPLGLEWEHKATWLDERDGKLYAVNPVTGYLWCFETRTASTSTGDGHTIPFYPVGKRIPFSGVYPPRNARDAYPPTSDPGKDSRMQQFLAPFKGGLLFWGSTLHDSGTFGYPRYAFWRRLGFTGDWTVVTMPQEFAANSFSAVSTAHDNSELVLLNGGGNYLETPGPWPFFWRLR
jgi:hypothetical protein